MTLPRVAIIALGGTIASLPQPSGATGATPQLTAHDLVAAVPALHDVADLRFDSLRNTPSMDLTSGDLEAVVLAIREAREQGHVGVVVTMGTDTLEEMAFVLDLVVPADITVVVTGAMRRPDLPGADGPANLLAAVQVATSAVARDLGVLVVMSDVIWPARRVRKEHTSTPAAFSAPGGAIGFVVEGRVRITQNPRGRLAPVTLLAPLPDVAVIPVGWASGDSLLRAVQSPDYAGCVLDAVGGGHVPSGWVATIRTLVTAMPVVVSSRTGNGEVLTSSYGYPGSEVDLAQAGVIGGGALTARQARLALMVALASTPHRDGALEYFAAVVARASGEERL